MRKLLSATVFLLVSLATLAQSSTEKISKEFTFEKKGNNTFMIANINGDVIVEGYNGDKVIVEATKTIKAKTEARLQKGKEELKLGIIDRADTIILYIDGLCSTFERNHRNWGGKHFAGWGYNWNDDCNRNKDWHKDEGYDYKIDFKVMAPSSINVTVSTINHGDIRVEKVSGAVKANNVNGAITLKNLTTAVNAYTINGDVDLDFDSNPNVECRFYTLNGDINALFKEGLAANLAFKSFNGELFSNVPVLDPLPVTLEKSESKKGVKYQVNGNRFKIGKGGVLLDFETFNGNVYVKEKN